MSLRNITPSSYVGPQVLAFRKLKGWTQQDLVDRLHELGITETGWHQTKIHKIESGKLTRVLVDDVFELALALDVSPLYLLTPTSGHDDQGNALKVWLGGDVAHWPREVRQWIRGVRPILSRGDYRSDDDARAGQRRYLLESQTLSEWNLIAESGNYASRVLDSIEALTPDELEEEQ